MPANDPLDRVLTIDLTKRRSSVDRRPELFEAGLGGVGVGIRLLDESGAVSADPLDPENAVVLCVGPLVGHYPLASKTVALFKSPHTGNLGESHAGGRSAVSLRLAGYGAMVLRGASETPVYLSVDERGARFRDASALWGLRSSYTVGTVLRERERGSGRRSILRIGPAGERGVTYASVITETYRHFGRLGLGTVFGSKRLKGIVIGGNRTLPVADAGAHRRAYDRIFRAATSSESMKKYHDLGTPMNVVPLNELGALPTRNLRAAQFDGADAISGEAIAEGLLGRRLACSHCPVACVHLAALRVPHPREPYFYKTLMLGYDYEPIYALGSLLGISDPAGMLRLMDEVEIQGLDAITTGVVLAWTTEALERGILTSKELDGVTLAWGAPDGHIEAVRRLISQPTDLYRALARGVEHAASVYGGEEFALAFGGNEMSGYHTGPAIHWTHLTGARHSHLDSAGYSVDQRAVGDAASPDEIIDGLIAEESWRQVLASLVVCFFARGIYTPECVVEALDAIGRGWDAEALERLGRETLARKTRFKFACGHDPTRSRIPERILTTETPRGRLDERELRRGLAHHRDRMVEAIAQLDDADG